MRVATSKDRSLLADRIILAAGPSTNNLLRQHLGCSFDLEIWQAHWGFYSCDPDLAAALPLWYYFGHANPATEDEALYYGFPPEPATDAMKVC